MRYDIYIYIYIYMCVIRQLKVNLLQILPYVFMVSCLITNGDIFSFTYNRRWFLFGCVLMSLSIRFHGNLLFLLADTSVSPVFEAATCEG